MTKGLIERVSTWRQVLGLGCGIVGEGWILSLIYLIVGGEGIAWLILGVAHGVEDA